MKIYGGQHTFLCTAVCGSLLCDRRLNASNTQAAVSENPYSDPVSLYAVDHSSDCGDYMPPVGCLPDGTFYGVGKACVIPEGKVVIVAASSEFEGWGPRISQSTRNRIERGIKALTDAGYRL